MCMAQPWASLGWEQVMSAGSFPSASGELWQDFLLSRYAEAMGEACDGVCACVLCSVLLLLPHTHMHGPDLSSQGQWHGC